MQHIFPNIPSLCSGLIPYPLILNAYRAFPITYVVSHPLPSPHLTSPHLTSPHLTSPHPLLPNTYETLPIPHPLSIHTGRFLRPPAMSHPHPIPSHPIPSLHSITSQPLWQIFRIPRIHIRMCCIPKKIRQHKIPLHKHARHHDYRMHVRNICGTILFVLIHIYGNTASRSLPRNRGA